MPLASPSVRDITVSERRARLGIRHRLAGNPAPDATEAAAAMVALHSSDPASVFLSAWARVDPFLHEDLERALYEQRTLIRLLGMRRTLFVVPLDVATLVQRGCTDDLLPGERRNVVSLIESQGLAADGKTWLAEVEVAALAALHERGQAFTSDLTGEVPGLEFKLTFGEGKKWQGEVGISSRVMFLLSTEGRIVRGRPRGTWISSQYMWTPTVDWLGGPIPEMDAAAARAELVRRWLGAFGPGTLADIRWWTGWTVAKTRGALEAVAAVPVTVDGVQSFVNPGDEGPVDDVAPWVAMLPSLDPTVMGWFDRSWYLGDHRPALFDRNGNAGPTIWADGRVVGGWALQPDGKVAHRLLEDVGAETQGAIDTEADRLERWLDGTAVTPRFRTPLERERSGR